jgi:hypothetical protein
MLIDSGKQREPTMSEIPAHATFQQVRLPLPGVRAVLRHDESWDLNASLCWGTFHLTARGLIHQNPVHHFF